MSQNTSTAIQVVQTPGALKTFLDKYSGEITNALPKHLKADRMIRLAMTAFSTTPALRECTVQSILSSIVIASQLGLEIGIGGQGYLIPYKDRRNNITICTFVPGWQGVVSLLNNTGRATAWSGVIYDGDDFTISLGSEQFVRNIPGENFGVFEKAKFVFACGKVNGSEIPVIEVWPIARVWKHRDKYNKVGERHYSYAHPEMYARKVVLLQVLKYMPKSIELQDAIKVVNADDAGKLTGRTDDGQIIEIETEPGDVPVEPVISARAGQQAPPQQQPPPATTTQPPAQKPAPPTKPAAAPKPAAAATPAPAAAPKLASLNQEAIDEIRDENLAATLNDLRESADIKPVELHAWAIRSRMIEPSQTIEQMAPAKLRRLLLGWQEVGAQIFDARQPVA